MKLLIENWRKFLSEDLDRSNFKCPASNRGFKTYYRIDRNNPPRLEDILNCWVNNSGYIYDSNVNDAKPAFYNTEELAPYREWDKDMLRNPVYSEQYKKLKKDIEENGIKQPIIITFGRNNKMKVSEGNHRHQIALELGLKNVPVRFVFYENVTVDSDPEIEIEEEPEEEEVEDYDISAEEEEDIDELLKSLFDL